MHYVAHLGYDVLVGILVARLDSRITPVLAKLPRRLAVRAWWLRRGNPDFILMPPGRDWPAGLGYRVPARLGDPFTGASWLVRH